MRNLFSKYNKFSNDIQGYSCNGSCSGLCDGTCKFSCEGGCGGTCEAVCKPFYSASKEENNKE